MITIVAVGKIKREYINEGITDYLKRISHFDKINVIETPEAAGNNDQIMKSAEGKDILSALPEGAYVIALDMRGRQLTSEEFSAAFDDIYMNRQSKVCFAIGGSNGLSDEVRQKADLVLSFSKMTFPHQLFRLILLEQIYRALKIRSNQTYHK